MLDELQTAAAQYLQKWQMLAAARSDQGFFNSLRPTAVGWKTVDLADFDVRAADLRAHADQIHFGWVNERWVTTFHLKEARLPGDITIVKLMQRRPASTDATGLDHLDFWFDRQRFDAKKVLSAEHNLEWTEEVNGGFCKWLSVWFENTEAKIRSDTVLDICIKEMKAVQPRLP